MIPILHSASCDKSYVKQIKYITLLSRNIYEIIKYDIWTELLFFHFFFFLRWEGRYYMGFRRISKLLTLSEIVFNSASRCWILLTLGK